MKSLSNQPTFRWSEWQIHMTNLNEYNLRGEIFHPLTKLPIAQIPIKITGFRLQNYVEQR